MSNYPQVIDNTKESDSHISTSIDDKNILFEQYKLLIDGYHVRDVAIVEQYDKALSQIQTHSIVLITVGLIIFCGHDSNRFLPDSLLMIVTALTLKQKLVVIWFVLGFTVLFTTPYHLTISKMTSSKNALRRKARQLENLIFKRNPTGTDYAYWKIINDRMGVHFNIDSTGSEYRVSSGSILQSIKHWKVVGMYVKVLGSVWLALTLIIYFN